MKNDSSLSLKCYNNHIKQRDKQNEERFIRAIKKVIRKTEKYFQQIGILVAMDGDKNIVADV